MDKELFERIIQDRKRMQKEHGRKIHKPHICPCGYTSQRKSNLVRHQDKYCKLRKLS